MQVSEEDRALAERFVSHPDNIRDLAAIFATIRAEAEARGRAEAQRAFDQILVDLRAEHQDQIAVAVRSEDADSRQFGSAKANGLSFAIQTVEAAIRARGAQP